MGPVLASWPPTVAKRMTGGATERRTPTGGYRASTSARVGRPRNSTSQMSPVDVIA